jgi:hypothetical protein
LLAASAVVVVLTAAGRLWAGPEAPPPASPTRQAERDSLLVEIRRYSRIVEGLRDSLASESTRQQVESQRRRQEMIDLTIQEFSGALSDLRRELDGLDLRVEDNVISFSDDEGGEVAITVPSDLGSKISEGITSITKGLLEEMPDTLRFGDAAYAWDFSPPGIEVKPRRVIDGDAIRFRDDMIVSEDEEIHGNVVVIFGDGVIAGRVDGDVTVVLGDLLIAETAEVTGGVTVLGRFERSEDARVGRVTVIDPLHGGGMAVSPASLFRSWIGFVVVQGLFLVAVVCAIVLLVLGPRSRLANVVDGIKQRPGGALGFGLLAAVFGHGAVLILLGVLVLTIVGIPLALLLLVALGLLAVAAVTAVALPLGRWACRALNIAVRRDWAPGLVGLVLIHVPNLAASVVGAVTGGNTLALLLGAIGMTGLFVVYVLGLGALIQTRLGTHPVQGDAVPAESVPAA